MTKRSAWPLGLIPCLVVAVVSAAALAQHHAADTTLDQRVSLSELLRTIQFFNSGGFHCNLTTEDGYAPQADVAARACSAHHSDYAPQDWTIALTELLRLVQFFNSDGYHTQCNSEDGCAPGGGALHACDGTPTPSPSQRSALGMNISAPRHSADMPFVNLMHSTGGFIDIATWSLLMEDLDANGWPTEIDGPATVSLMGWAGELAPHFPAGNYILLYEGAGKLEVDGATEVIGSREVNGNTTRVLYNFTPGSEGLWLTLHETDPDNTGNHLRNIRFLLPGHEQDYATQIFNPRFLQAWQDYSVFRHVQSMQVWPFQQDLEEDPFSLLDVEWSDRALPGDFRWGLRWSHETAIALSNRLQSDIWITIPHTASEDYVEQLAQLVLAQLDPGLRVYLEYTNEPWNPMSATYVWLREQGLAEGLGTVAGMGDTTDETIIALRKYSQLAVQYTGIFDAAFAAAGREADLVLVYGGFENVYHYNEDEDGVENGNELGALYYPVAGRPAYTYFDAWGTTSYIAGGLGFEHQYVAMNWSVDELITYIQTGQQPATDTVVLPTIPGTDIKESTLAATLHGLEDMHAFAERYGMHHVVYEGGPHLVALQFGWNPERGEYALTDEEFERIDSLFSRAIEDERLEGIMTTLLEGARDAGVKTHVMFDSSELPGLSQWSKFGFLSHIFQDFSTSPKYRATQAWMQANPRWWSSLQREDL